MDKSILSDFAITNITELSNYLKLVALKLMKDEIKPDVNTVKFDIAGFFDAGRPTNGMDCHTSACAVGHFALMHDLKHDKEGAYTKDGEFFEWRHFSEECVGIKQWGEQGTVWEFLFSGKWAFVDNTPLGAAARIDHFLEHGVPDGFIKSPIFQETGIYSPIKASAKNEIVGPYLLRRQTLEAECLKAHNHINRASHGATHG